MWGSAEKKRFDFRVATQERERAIRILEAMLLRCKYTGEDLDRELFYELQDVIAGRQTSVGIDLTDSVQLSFG